MEFHYTVIYDDKVNAWSVEPDPSMYYQNGNIYDPLLGGQHSWSFPEENSPEEALDMELFRTLQYIVSTFPVPQSRAPSR